MTIEKQQLLTFDDLTVVKDDKFSTYDIKATPDGTVISDRELFVRHTLYFWKDGTLILRLRKFEGLKMISEEIYFVEDEEYGIKVWRNQLQAFDEARIKMNHSMKDKADTFKRVVNKDIEQKMDKFTELRNKALSSDLSDDERILLARAIDALQEKEGLPGASPSTNISIQRGPSINLLQDEPEQKKNKIFERKRTK